MRKITSIIIFSATLCAMSGCIRRSVVTQEKKEATTQSPEKQITERPLKKVDLMNIDEARNAALYYKEIGNDHNRALALERVVLLTGDSDELGNLMRELAALHEKMENYEDACTVYEQYTKLFPGNPDISYMTYKMIEVISKQISDVRRDQSKIRQLTEQTQAFLKRFGEDDTHAKSVARLRTRGYQLLAQSELARARFYLDRYNYTLKTSSLRAAGKRLEEAERVIVNLDFDAATEKSVEEAMDAIRAEDFDKKTPEDQIAIINRTLPILAKAAGEEAPRSGASALFKGKF